MGVRGGNGVFDDDSDDDRAFFNNSTNLINMFTMLLCLNASIFAETTMVCHSVVMILVLNFEMLVDFLFSLP